MTITDHGDSFIGYFVYFIYLRFKSLPKIKIKAIVDPYSYVAPGQRRQSEVFLICFFSPREEFFDHFREQDRKILNKKQNLIVLIQEIVCDSRTWIDQIAGLLNEFQRLD